MKKNKIVIGLSLFLLSSPFSMISCSNNKQIYNIKKLDYNFSFQQAFQSKEFENNEIKNNNIWKHNEIIYENERFLIDVDSVYKNVVYVDLYNKEISKYYLIKFNFNNNLHLFKKEDLNKVISEDIVNNFDSQMTNEYSLNNDEIYIPFSNEKNTIEIKKDGYTSFRTSWGVAASSTKETEFSFKVSNNLIRESLMSKKHMGDERVQIKSIKLKDLYYVPLVEVIKTPIWHSRYWQNKIVLNNKEIENDLENKKFDLILPKGSQSGQEWWHGLVSALGLAGFIAQIAIMFCVSSEVPFISDLAYKYLQSAATGKFGFSLVWGFIKENHEDNLDIKIDETIDNIKKLGIKTSINKNIDINEESIINIDGKVKYDAKATNIFGRQSKAKIKNVIGIANSEISWIEYKEFNNNEKI